MYVKTGSRLVYVASYENSFATRLTLSVGEMLSKISSDLHSNHGIAVESTSNNLSTFGAHVDYTLNVLTQDTDYASENDVRSIIDHYFYIEGGELPAASRIVSVKQPSGDTTDTGAPPEPPEDNTEDPNAPDWLDKLKAKIEIGSVGVVVGIALVIGVVLFVTAREVA